MMIPTPSGNSYRETNPRNGGLMDTPATSFSLLIFYAFAMMCMSTLAVVHRETRWSLSAIQFLRLHWLTCRPGWYTRLN